MKDISRRGFVGHLLAGAGATLALSALPDFAAAHEHAAAQLKSKSVTRKLEFFTPAEAADLDAFCAQIIPSDSEGPGAREAGSLYFIDYVVTHTEPHLQNLFRDGLKQLAADSAPQAFAALSSEQQIAIMKKYEGTKTFKTARAYTKIGFLGDPKYGGNRDQVGWKYIGFENTGMFSPPFG